MVEVVSRGVKRWTGSVVQSVYGSTEEERLGVRK